MKAKIYLVITFACIMVFSNIAFSGNPGKRGTAGAVELLMPVGARGVALSGATLATSTGVDAIYWNPAGLAPGLVTSGIQAMFSHTSYIADIGIEYGAIGLSLGEFGAVGLSLKTYSFGEMLLTTEDIPEGTGATFSPNYTTIGLTYSRNLTDRISIGFTGKLINESIVRTSAQGFALDGGVIYTVGAASILRGVKFGIALKNIGPNMRFDGADLERNVKPPDSDPASVEIPMKIISQEFELPSTFEMGVSYEMNFEDHVVTSSVGFQNSNFGDDLFRFGGEYSFKNMFFLRIGYAVPDGDISNQLQRLTFGGGVEIPVGSTNIIIDYAYTQVQLFDGLQTISMRLVL